MHENRIYYNLSEANALIPKLEHIFAKLAKLTHQVNYLSDHAKKLGIELMLDEAREGNFSSHPVRRELQERIIDLSDEYAWLLEEMYDMGVIVDNLDLGIVNFYSWIDGNEVFLSWQYGEPEILNWHAVTENSDARRSLDNFTSSAPAEVSLH